jgi:hypothetical protein
MDSTGILQEVPIYDKKDRQDYLEDKGGGQDYTGAKFVRV